MGRGVVALALPAAQEARVALHCDARAKIARVERKHAPRGGSGSFACPGARRGTIGNDVALQQLITAGGLPRKHGFGL